MLQLWGGSRGLGEAAPGSRRGIAGEDAVKRIMQRRREAHLLRRGTGARAGKKGGLSGGLTKRSDQRSEKKRKVGGGGGGQDEEEKECPGTDRR